MSGDRFQNLPRSATIAFLALVSATASPLSVSVPLVKKLPARRLFVLFAIASILAIVTPGRAADSERGEALVEQWCETCHLADNRNEASDVGPPFAQIAKDPDYTDSRLRGWLHDPHPPMPKFELDRHMIDDIIAYIRTLRK